MRQDEHQDIITHILQQEGQTHINITNLNEYMNEPSFQEYIENIAWDQDGCLKYLCIYLIGLLAGIVSIIFIPMIIEVKMAMLLCLLVFLNGILCIIKYICVNRIKRQLRQKTIRAILHP